MKKQIIILAAGKGSRMNSDLPKVMHKVAGISMLERVVSNCYEVTHDLTLVYSKHIELYLSDFENRCKLVNQGNQRGTAHAVSMAKDFFDDDAQIGVIYGDNPLITPSVINGIFNHLQNTSSAVTTLAFQCDPPNQYGKIITDESRNFQRIVESKFANDQEQKITLCNSGIMVFAPNILKKYIDQCLITDHSNPKKELYLTDIIEVCVLNGEKVSYFELSDPRLVIGVNTQDDLAKANSIVEVK
ncbi:NTP transferase domain-containing protein [Rickettsiaceae bacterium]|nr:NTP transferase domain-containing protein [Rickettsiaceae bacterium]